MSDGDKKICFVIGPIGDPDSEVRIHADWLLEEIIYPVFQEFKDYKVIRADQISQPGMIDAQIIRYLIDSELVIADLSMLNPNAFYEIGVRHMVQKPIIHVQLVEDKIPFDVSLYRATKFSRARPSDLRKAREELTKSIAAVNSESYQVENPVTRARGQIKLSEHATPEQQVVLDQLKVVEQRLDAIEGRSIKSFNTVEEEWILRATREKEFGDGASRVYRILRKHSLRTSAMLQYEHPDAVELRLNVTGTVDELIRAYREVRDLPGILVASRH